MLERYRDVAFCKEDINVFISLVKNDVGQVSEEKLVCIAKGILLHKKVFFCPEKNLVHYYNCLLSDMLNWVHSLGVKSLKLFYTTYRSLIENYIRVYLKYDEENETGIRNMFNEIRDICGANGKEFIDYLEGEYGKCCNVVHSNIQGNIPVYSYYDELLQADEMGEKIVESCLQIMNTFYVKCKKFVIKNKKILIDEEFYNHKELLKYLLGDKDYNEFEKIDI